MTSTNWRLIWGCGLGAVLAALSMVTTVHAQFGRTVPMQIQDMAHRASLRVSVASEATQRIEAALLHRQDWDLAEAPIVDLVDILRKQFHFPVVLDKAALQDEGVDPSSPLPDVRGVMTLNRFLELTLHSMQLTHFVEDGVLMITTEANADEVLTLKIYPVLDLVRRDDADDYSSLMLVIQEATSGIWEQVDGVGGTMTPLPTTGSLVIKQTWKIHREIEGLLFAARQARRLQHMPSLSVETSAFTGITVGRDITFGNELATAQRTESAMLGSTPKSSSAAAWRIPRVDTPRRR